MTDRGYEYAHQVRSALVRERRQIADMVVSSVMRDWTNSVMGATSADWDEAKRDISTSLVDAPAIWVSPASTELIQTRISSAVGEVDVPPNEHCPYPQGTVVFARPVVTDHYAVSVVHMMPTAPNSNGEPSSVLLNFGPRPFVEPAEGLNSERVAPNLASRMGLFYHSMGVITWDSTVITSRKRDRLMVELLKSLASDESGVTVARHGDKVTSRKAKNSGAEDPDHVHVVYLRDKESKTHGPSAPEPGSSVRAHRRRAHMRRQPYGPIDLDPRPWKWKLIPATVVNPDRGDPDAVATVHRRSA